MAIKELQGAFLDYAKAPKITRIECWMVRGSGLFQSRFKIPEWACRDSRQSQDCRHYILVPSEYSNTSNGNWWIFLKTHYEDGGSRPHHFSLWLAEYCECANWYECKRQSMQDFCLRAKFNVTSFPYTHHSVQAGVWLTSAIPCTIHVTGATLIWDRFYLRHSTYDLIQQASLDLELTN